MSKEVVAICITNPHIADNAYCYSQIKKMSAVHQANPSNIAVKNLPVLIILHQARSVAGRVGQMLRASGFPLDIRRPVLGDDLPKTLKNHAGAIIFGGPMSANDKQEFIRKETDWLQVPLSENKPFLGVCLGAQMLARHIGGRVARDERGLAEAGWYSIDATEIGKKLFDWPQKVYQFHREGIYDLPREAQILARSDNFPIQAFRFGEAAWGIQFHAELTQLMMQRWVVHGAVVFEDRGAQKGQEHLQGRLIYDKPLRQWLEQALGRIFGAKIMPRKNEVNNG